MLSWALSPFEKNLFSWKLCHIALMLHCISMFDQVELPDTITLPSPDAQGTQLSHSMIEHLNNDNDK